MRDIVLEQRVDDLEARLDKHAALIQDLQVMLDRYKAMDMDDEEDRLKALADSLGFPSVHRKGGMA